MSERVFFSGDSYVDDRGRVVADEGAKEVYRRLGKMLLLAGRPQHPFFYVDPADETYWEFVEFEDDHVQLKRVTREYIETNWPEVDCDRRITVSRPPID